MPPLASLPHFIQLPRDPDKRATLLDEITALVSKRALIPADPGTPGFYSHLFVVPKKSGGFRPVIDLKALNKFITCRTFRMETPRSIRDQLRQGEWTTSIDLADAYLHIPIDRAFQPFLRVAVLGQVWQFQAMPFGLNIAPRTFTYLLAPVAAALRAQGIHLHRYLDDWLIRAPTPQLATAHTTVVLNLFHSLGLLVRREKSDLTPRQDFVFLGVHFDTLSATVAPTEDKVTGLIHLLGTILTQSQIQVRLFLRLLGIINHMAEYIPLGRLYLRPLQFYLLSFHQDLRSNLEAILPIRPALRLALWPWTDATWLSTRVPLRRPDPSTSVSTDASLVGWGAHWGDRLLSGQWSPEETQLHISILELRAIRQTLLALSEDLAGQTVRIMTDSISAAAYIRREGGTHSISLYQEARSLLMWCHEHQITLIPHFLPGHLNVLADLQSRPHQVLSTEWTLQVDMSASHCTKYRLAGKKVGWLAAQLP